MYITEADSYEDAITTMDDRIEIDSTLVIDNKSSFVFTSQGTYFCEKLETLHSKYIKVWEVK